MASWLRGASPLTSAPPPGRGVSTMHRRKRTSMNELRDQAEGSVPEPLSTGDGGARGAGAEKSWRRGWLVAGVGAVVIVLVIVLVPGWLGQSGGTTAPVATANPPSANPSGALPACPTDQAAFSGSMTPLTLPTGAVALRWCTLSEPSGFLAVYPPPEPLTVDVDRFITAFNALKPFPANQACTADASTPGLALVTYPDGTSRAVAGMAAGCGVIGGRLGFTQMQQLAVDLLVAARGPSFAPPTVAFPLCGPGRSVIPADLPKVTRAALCERAGGPGGSPSVREIDPGAIPALRTDIAAHLVRSDGSDAPDGAELQLYQANGERVSLQYSSRTARWQLTRWNEDRRVAPEHFTWTPDATSMAAVQAAQRGPTSVPSGSPSASAGTPAPVGSSAATVVDACTAVATPVDKPEPGLLAVTFCSNWRYAPTDVLTTNLDQFLKGFEAETFECAPRPQDEAFVLAYPEGARRISLPAARCASRTNAVRTFVSLLAQQRGPGFQGELVTVPKLCELKQANSLAENVMPMEVADATLVRVCPDFSKGQTGDAIDGRLVTPEQAKAVLDDLLAHSKTLPPAIDPPAWPVGLVLQRRNGERIWVHADPAGTMRWIADARWYEWTPSPAVRQILDSYR